MHSPGLTHLVNLVRHWLALLVCQGWSSHFINTYPQLFLELTPNRVFLVFPSEGVSYYNVFLFFFNPLRIKNGKSSTYVVHDSSFSSLPWWNVRGSSSQIDEIELCALNFPYPFLCIRVIRCYGW